MTAEAKALAPGALVRLEAADGRPIGTAGFNRHTLIAARLLAREPDVAVDEGFLHDRLARALAVRERLIDTPHYRMVHAEADGLPGLVADRFGDTLVLQLNAAVMQALEAPLLAALDALVQPATVVLRNDTPARALEGLAQEVRVARGAADGPVELIEYGARFLADPLAGQKTGWFFDQRDNRAWTARLAQGARVLDAYTYAGGFAVQAALAGAASVTALDRSESALALVSQAAAANGVAGTVSAKRGEVFGELQAMAGSGERFDLAICDPPAFAKTRKDVQPALRGYRKLARLAAQVVAPGGYLALCSCSHHVGAEDFAEQCARGLHDAGRFARLLRRAGAAPDHPVHPRLAESDYLKCLIYALD
jgi:23S rRNA (cytosine1962-C5)-methyltransferase